MVNFPKLFVVILLPSLTNCKDGCKGNCASMSKQLDYTFAAFSKITWEPLHWD